MDDQHLPPYLTLQQAAEVSNFSEATIRSAIKSGKLKAAKPSGRENRIAREDFRDWMTGRIAVLNENLAKDYSGSIDPQAEYIASYMFEMNDSGKGARPLPEGTEISVCQNNVPLEKVKVMANGFVQAKVPKGCTQVGVRPSKRKINFT